MESKKYLWLLPIRSILFIVIFILVGVITNTTINETARWWTLAINIVNAITIGILLVICKQRKIRFMQLFNKEKAKSTKKEIFIGAVAIPILALLGMYIVGWIVYKEIPYTPEALMKPIPIALAIINIAILPITTTIAEEGLYLGIGVKQIENKKLSIIIPLFFYMLQHSFFPLIVDIRFIVYRFFSLFFMLTWICIYYKKSNKVIPVMVGHFITNFVTVIELLLISI